MKVHPFKIPKPPNECLHVQVDRHARFHPYLHQHQEMQLSLIRSGTGQLIVTNEIYTFQAGDIFLIGQQTPHMFKSAKDSPESHMVTLFLDLETLGATLLALPEMTEVHRFLLQVSHGYQLMDAHGSLTQLLSALPQRMLLERTLDVIHVLDLIMKMPKTELAPLGTLRTLSNREGLRLQLVFDHITNHFQGKIHLKEVAQLAHMTPNAFCRFFKQHTHRTLFDFIIQLRLQHALQLLLTKEHLPISEIAETSGFQSISQFNRKFKEWKGKAPSQYRKAIKSLQA
ncbi:MAG: AraC family transcriptional regulator [Flavobacteriaceae bacterium]